MLDFINDYLQLGVDNAGSTLSVWPLAVATALVAAMILKRQSDD